MQKAGIFSEIFPLSSLSRGTGNLPGKISCLLSRFKVLYLGEADCSGSLNHMEI